MSAPTSPAPRAATALRRVAALLRLRPLRAARAGAGPSRSPSRAGGPAVVTAPDRDALHRLLTGLLLEHPGEPMALLLVGLLPADGRDGVGDGSEDLLRALVEVAGSEDVDPGRSDFSLTAQVHLEPWHTSDGANVVQKG
ncbi:hypothetical protein HLB09_04020, partial [Pseudokineococcus marinus]